MAIGVGVFLVLALLRILFRVRLSYLLIGFYILAFILAFFVPTEFLSVAFDAGGVTTGPMTVPFIMALGVGVASIRSDKQAQNDSFDLVSLCSIGPILAVLLLGMIYRPDCTDKGSEKRVCDTCKAEESREVAALGHVWDKDFTVDKQATCTEDGSKSIHCSTCEATMYPVAIPAIGHTFGEWEVRTPATTQAAGEEVHVCEICEVEETREIAQPTDTTTVLYGDVNADGKVDSSDARVVLQAAVGKTTLDETQQTAADVNGDNKIDSSDARYILQKAVNKVDTFPVEE